MKKCEYCGALIDRNAAKCQYCGHFNYEGAQKEYMEKMDDIKEDLEEIKEDIKSSKHINRELKKEQKKISKLITIILVSIGLFVGSCTILGVIGNSVIELLEEKENNREVELREIHYPVLNKLVKEKNYEELSNYFNEQYDLDSDFYKCVYNWKYSEIVYIADYYFNQPDEIILPIDKDKLLEYLNKNDYEYKHYMQHYFELYRYILMADGKFEEHQLFIDMAKKETEEKIDDFDLNSKEKENLINYATGISYDVSFYDLSKMIIKRKVEELNEM